MFKSKFYVVINECAIGMKSICNLLAPVFCLIILFIHFVHVFCSSLCRARIRQCKVRSVKLRQVPDSHIYVDDFVSFSLQVLKAQAPSIQFVICRSSCFIWHEYQGFRCMDIVCTTWNVCRDFQGRRYIGNFISLSKWKLPGHVDYHSMQFRPSRSPFNTKMVFHVWFAVCSSIRSLLQLHKLIVHRPSGDYQPIKKSFDWWYAVLNICAARKYSWEIEFR